MKTEPNQNTNQGHDGNTLLAVSGLIEKWKLKHHELLDVYSKGNANEEVMQMYRSYMKMVLDFIDDLSVACAIAKGEERKE